MRPRLGHALVLGALVCALAAGAFAQVDSVYSETDSKARIVRLSFVQGDVRMDRPDSGGLDTAFLNMPIVEGSRVVTGDDGFAELEFESGGTVRLTPGSELRVRELGLRGDHQVSMLELGEGTAYFNVKKDPNDDFRVVVEGQEVRVAKSARFRIRAGRGSSEIAVTKGELELIGSERAVHVRKDETLTLDPQDPGRYFLARSVTPFSYDTWDRERDEYRERYVATSSSYRGYSSGYSYGVSDLNYYGSYINTAGYGYVWRPYGYDASWDPYSDGAWVWYPGYGYTWISGYPWGWMPYRYGRWIYVGGYGWVWQPGNSWHRWNRCSAAFDPGHHHHGPTPPAHGGGGRPGGGTPGSGGGSGRRDGKVVVVGNGPFTGRGPGFKNDGDENPHAGGRGRAVLGAGNAAPAPAVLTPGLQPNSVVGEELRRVHGKDLGLPIRVRQQQTDAAAAATTTVTTPSGSTASESTAAGSAASGNTGAGNAMTGGGVSPQQGNTPKPGRGARSDEAVAANPATGSAATTTTTVTPTTTVTATPGRPARETPAPAPGPVVSRPAQTYSPPASTYRGNSGSSGGGASTRSPGSSSRPSSSPSSSSSGRSSSGSSSSSSSHSSSSHSSSSSHNNPK